MTFFSLYIKGKHGVWQIGSRGMKGHPLLFEDPIQTEKYILWRPWDNLYMDILIFKWNLKIICLLLSYIFGRTLEKEQARPGLW